MNRAREMAQQLITFAVFPEKQNTVPSNQIRKLLSLQLQEDTTPSAGLSEYLHSFEYTHIHTCAHTHKHTQQLAHRPNLKVKKIIYIQTVLCKGILRNYENTKFLIELYLSIISKWYSIQSFLLVLFLHNGRFWKIMKHYK